MEKYFLIPDHVYSRAGIKMGNNSYGTKEMLNLPAHKNIPLNELQTEVNSLNADDTLTPEIKWEKYKHIFGKFFTQKNSQNAIIPTQPLSAPDVGENQEENNIVELPFDLNTLLKSFPKSLRNTVEIVYNLFSHSTDFRKGIYSWTEKGELSINGQPILGSNIFDLLDYLLRKRIKPPVTGPPAGWNLFYYTVLPSINFPQYLKAPFLTRPSDNPFSFDDNTDVSDADFYDAVEANSESMKQVLTKRAKRALEYDEGEKRGHYTSWKTGI